jgi:hypothetical protein
MHKALASSTHSKKNERKKEKRRKGGRQERKEGPNSMNAYKKKKTFLVNLIGRIIAPTKNVYILIPKCQRRIKVTDGMRIANSQLTLK